MPLGLRRFQQSKQSHFITFSCHERLPVFRDPRLCDLFLNCLEQARQRYQFRVYGFVVMPEHVHLLVSEPDAGALSRAIQAINFFYKKGLKANEENRILVAAVLRSQCSQR